MRRLLAGATAVAATAWALPAAADQTTNLVQAEGLGEIAEVAAVALDRAAGVDFDGQAPAEALSVLREEAGVRILFSPSLLPDDVSVHCACRDRSVREALHEILEETRFGFSEEGMQVLVEPAEDRRPAPDLDDALAAVPAVNVSAPTAMGSPRSVSLPRPPAALRTGVVTGTVVDEEGRPVANAQVRIVGTDLVAISGQDGSFRLEDVDAGEREVRAQAIGFTEATQTVNVASGDEVTVRIVVETSALPLDEVVVTGQAAGVARREIGTSIASIDAADLEAAPIQNFSQLLQARAPGVNVLPGGGKSGQGTRVVLRGAASISQDNEPLIYVDGVRMDNSSASGISTTTAGVSWAGLDDINPDDIERVEIVRGASAATLYGTEAAAGVIQIFTKQGDDGPTVWSYSGEGGLLDTPFRYWDVSQYSPWFYDNMVSTGHHYSQQLSVRGGGDGFSYYASGTMRGEDGVLPNDGEDYYSARVNMSLYPRDNLTLRLNTSFSNRSVQHVPDANNTRGYTINGLVGGPRGQFVETLTLPEIQAFQEGSRYTGSVAAEHQISEALSQRVTLGADVWNQDQHQFFPFQAISNLPDGFRSNYRRENTNLNLDYAATLRYDLTSDLRSTTSGGFQAFDRDLGWSSAIGSDFPFFGLETVGSTIRTSGTESRFEERSAGFFLEQQLGFRNYLFATVGARADGHSAFGDDVDYQVYPKADVSYVMSDHLDLPDFVSTLRLRGAYGTAGQQPSAFAAVRTWNSTSAVGAQPAVTPSNLGNPALSPEVTHELELGFEAGIFDERLQIDVTRYDQSTEDALYAVRRPPSLGHWSPQLENVGEIANEGWEIGGRGEVIDHPRFGWDAFANISTNDNEIVSLGGGSPIQLQWLQWMREGYPVGSFFGDRPIEHEGEVGLASELLADEDGELPEGWDYIGPGLPTRTIQLGSDFRIGSPSEEGVKVYVAGAPDELPAHTIPMDAASSNGKRPAVEVYTSGRYFAVTGRILDGVPDEIRDAGELGDAWDRMVARLQEYASRNGDGPRERAAVEPTGTTEIPEELQRTLEGDGKAGQFWKVGKDSGTDWSRNDAALAATLGAMGFEDEAIEAALRAYPLGQIGQGAEEGRYQAPVIHEAAHAAMAHFLGLEVEWVAVYDQPQALADRPDAGPVAGRTKIPTSFLTSEVEIDRTMFFTLAGPIMDPRFRNPLDGPGDREEVKALLARYGLGEDEARALLRSQIQVAREWLRELRPAVVALANELAEHRELRGARVKRIVKKAGISFGSGWPKIKAWRKSIGFDDVVA